MRTQAGSGIRSRGLRAGGYTSVAGGGVDHRGDGADPVGRKASATRMLLHDVLVGSRVDAVDLVVGHVAREPTDLWAELPDHLVRRAADGSQLLRGEPPRPGQLPLDQVLGHLDPLPTGSYRWSASGILTVC